MEKIPGGDADERAAARKRRDEEFERYVKEEQLKEAGRRNVLSTERGAKDAEHKTTRSAELSDVKRGLEQSREQLDRLDDLQNKIKRI